MDASLEKNSTPLNIAVIGAGLAGRLLAWRLISEGHVISLYEKTGFDQPQSAAYTAAAMISPLSEVVVSERAIYDLGIRSLKLWPEWLETLKLHSNQNVSYQANGSIVVAHPQDQSELQQFYQDLHFHLGSDNEAKWLSRSELQTKEPDLASHFDSGLFLPDEAFVDNRMLLLALLSAIKKQGARCIDHCGISANEIKQGKDVRFVQTDLVIDCRGMGAADHIQNLRGVRGEVLWVETPEVRFQHAIRLMHPRYKLYVVPKPNNAFIIGATEIESSDNSPVSVQSMLELCSALYTLNPAFAEARIKEIDANLRPSLLDNLPKISTQILENGQTFISLNGLYRHGYLLAPALVEDALALISNLHKPKEKEFGSYEKNLYQP